MPCTAYLLTLMVTVLDIALPFFGLTDTVTLQDPAFKPLRLVPETRQYSAEPAETDSDTVDVEETFIFA